MKACFQIAECSLSYAKIRTFSKRAYTWFPEDVTIIGDLLSFVLKHFNHIPVATHKLATFIQHTSIDETAFLHDSS
jgi:hypothetical protein